MKPNVVKSGVFYVDVRPSILHIIVLLLIPVGCEIQELGKLIVVNLDLSFVLYETFAEVGVLESRVSDLNPGASVLTHVH